MLFDLKLHRASLLVERKLNGYLRKAGINVLDLGVLIAASESAQCQVEIATALDVHPNLVTQACGRLQQRDYIDRQRDGEDGRKWMVSLTPAGQSLVRTIKGEMSLLARLILYPLSEEEIAQFDSMLTKILANPGEPFNEK